MQAEAWSGFLEKLDLVVTESYTTPTHSDASLKAAPCKAPFGYYGAKLRIAGQIIRGLPPHHAWVEAFCGSAAITLAKPPVPIEVINDADGEVVNSISPAQEQTGEAVSGRGLDTLFTCRVSSR